MKHVMANAVDIACWVIVVPMIIYLGYRSFKDSENRAMLITRWALTIPLIAVLVWLVHMESPYTPIFVLPPALFLAILWAPNLGAMMARPLTDALDGGAPDGEKRPFYFIAEGKRRKGLYHEAAAEVRKQLQIFPGDYEGYMKLAAIQMENLQDLQSATATLEEFLSLPDRAPTEVISVLHMLADWQLQFARDAAAATATLKRIIDTFPGTPMAHAAEQRIAHLGQADETHRARHEGKFVVKQGERDLGLRTAAFHAPVGEEPMARAQALVSHLEAHPTDTDAREQLAMLYAEGFQRMDLAADQLEQLIAIPSESPKHVAHWLNLLATLQIKFAQDLRAAESALHRIIEKFPGGALAVVATSRLATLQAELKPAQKTAPKALGTYEKNLGLKISQ
jgi:tetratricopeptide (TPR) repeat protein